DMANDFHLAPGHPLELVQRKFHIAQHIQQAAPEPLEQHWREVGDMHRRALARWEAVESRVECPAHASLAPEDCEDKPSTPEMAARKPWRMTGHHPGRCLRWIVARPARKRPGAEVERPPVNDLTKENGSRGRTHDSRSCSPQR